MQKIWRQFGRHLDIVIMLVTSLFIAGVAWANINSKLDDHDKHLAAIDSVQAQQSQQMGSVQQTAARTEQKVDDMSQNIEDIKEWLRHRP